MLGTPRLYFTVGLAVRSELAFSVSRIVSVIEADTPSTLAIV